jgi:PAS domain S-box-containing protein
LKFLVVEDNEDSRIFLTALLEGHGHDVSNAADGRIALEMAKETKPDLIISDILMPHMDGFELCQEIKSDANLVDIPFIFYTSTYTNPQDEELGLALGGTQFIIKPQEPDKLIKTINQIITNSKNKKPLLVDSADDKATFSHMRQKVITDKLYQKVRELENEHEALNKSEQKYRGLVESFKKDFLFFTKNLEGEYTYVSPSIKNILGYTQEEFLLHHKQIFTEPPVAKESASKTVYELKGEEQPPYEIKVFHKNGTPYWLEVKDVPIFDSKGNATSIDGIAQDITQRKELEKTQREQCEKLEMENVYLRDEFKTELSFGDIIGRSPSLIKALEEIRLVADSDSSVLILGETGTGKELVARAIHQSSPRHKQPLVKVNCGSVSRELFESEFFGHLKGAFTGAIKDRPGRFQLADKGTLFLDEISEIPIDLQSKLLRVLQEQQFEHVGEDITRSVDVRIIAATNRNLEEEVKNGRFREDLFYRLNVFPIVIPPLRDRKEDIGLLANYFAEDVCRRLNKKLVPLTDDNLQSLTEYDWPGNIRELQNIIERAIIISKGEPLHFDLVPFIVSSSKETSIPDSVLSESEEKYRQKENLLAALEKTNWKIYGKGGAAELLGLTPQTLAYRIKKLCLKKNP